LSDATSIDAALATAVTDDAFLGGALDVLQPTKGYRAGLDGVLLAASVAAGGGERVLDAGAGVGVVGLAVARRIPHVRVTLVERNRGLAALARQNIARNALAERVHLVEADIVRPLREIAELAAAAGSFDHVVANPPYHVEGQGTAAVDPGKAAANAMPAGALERWLRFMAAMARPGGIATLIHRADALHEILSAVQERFGAAVVLPLHPRADEPASRVLVQAIKDSRGPLELRPPLVLHDAYGFRPEVEAILRRGVALDLRNLQARP
jgi:tRNA1(Val) A37 N6-methylase TrmN6